jgi:xanthine dehydrogenase FAD-binding subunit
MTMLNACRPTSLAELVAVMRGADRVHLIAGGTDLLVGSRALPDAGRLVDLTALPALRGIDTTGPDIRIGAATTAAEIERHAELALRYPALVQAAAECGSVQIRNRATLAGNIANAAAGADLIPPLLLAGARIAGLTQGGAECEIGLKDYQAGSGILITTVILPANGFGPDSAFVKLGQRRDLTIARINLSVTAQVQDRQIVEPRIVAGALAPRPIPLLHAASVLGARGPDADGLRAFLDALSAEVDAAIPGRASQGWKRQAIRGLGIDLIARLLKLSNRDPLFDGVM